MPWFRDDGYLWERNRFGWIHPVTEFTDDQIEACIEIVADYDRMVWDAAEVKTRRALYELEYERRMAAWARRRATKNRAA